jgi:hypothetical protein
MVIYSAYQEIPKPQNQEASKMCRTIISAIIIIGMLMCAGCKKEGAAEKAGKKLDEAGKSLQDSAERAKDSIEKSTR